jgi:quinol monooxygenase YgiN
VPRFGLHGRITAKPGQGDALIEVLLDASRVLDADDDCLLYVVSRSPDDPDAVIVTEAWESEDAHVASLRRDDVLEVIARPTADRSSGPERRTVA